MNRTVKNLNFLWKFALRLPRQIVVHRSGFSALFVFEYSLFSIKNLVIFTRPVKLDNKLDSIR